MNELFEICLADVNLDTREEARRNMIATCRTCKHRERWEYENGRIAQYCGKRKSGRTHNGRLKIKVTNPACCLYEHQD